MAVAAGQWEPAIAACREVINRCPKSGEAYFHLAYLLKQSGRPDEAIAAYQRALELQPGLADAWNNLGNLLLESGKVPQAIECLRRAVARKPNDATKHNNLGTALQAADRLDEAIESFHRAVALAPNFIEAMVHLGSALVEADRAGEAVELLQRAIRIRADLAEAYCVLGRALHKFGRAEESIQSLQRAIELRPHYPTALNNLGVVLLEQNQTTEAIATFRKLVVLQPALPEPRVNLGNALLGEGLVDEAIIELERAHTLRPNDAQTLSNLAGAYASGRRFDEAERSFARAIEFAPDVAEIRWNLALMQLLLGDYQEGWQNYEARWGVSLRIFHRRFTQPLWDGSNLAGKRILLHAEQGFGDAIQFVRYVPLVASRGGHVILHCQPELRRLFGSVRGVERVITSNDSTPPFDVHCPLMTLPLRFGTTLQTIPADGPYLSAEPQLVERWKGRLADSSGNLKVGVAWFGAPGNKNNRERSIDLESLVPLLQTPQVSFFSLQKDAPPDHAMRNDAAKFTDPTAELTDFAETAALIDALDLVITIDTSIAHLAGAMGKPVWVLLSYGGDWRYLLDREDSPWYPSMRLFRQSRRGQWQEPIERAKSELARLAQAQRPAVTV